MSGEKQMIQEFVSFENFKTMNQIEQFDYIFFLTTHFSTNSRKVRYEIAKTKELECLDYIISAASYTDLKYLLSELERTGINHSYLRYLMSIKYDELGNFASNYPINFNPGDLNTSIVTNNRNEKLHESEIYFSNIKDEVIRCINTYDTVIGCVAWLDGPDYFDAIRKSGINCNLIINKENWFRQSYNFNDLINSDMQIPNCELTYQHAVINELTYLNTLSNVNIKCCGASELHTVSMHHKFLIFLNSNNEDCIMTGSFNLSGNAPNNLENVIKLYDYKTINAYYKEFLRVSIISEPLDWHNDHCEPDPKLLIGPEDIFNVIEKDSLDFLN